MVREIINSSRYTPRNGYLARCPISHGSQTRNTTRKTIGNTTLETFLELPLIGPYTSDLIAAEFKTRRRKVFSDLLDYFFRKSNDAKVNNELQSVPDIHVLWALEALLELPHDKNIRFHNILSPLIPKVNKSAFENVWRQYYESRVPYFSLGLTSSMREHLIKLHETVMSNPYG